MEKEDHIKRHQELHRSLDELLADFLMHNTDKLPSTTTVFELLNWSHKQTTGPTELE